MGLRTLIVWVSYDTSVNIPVSSHYSRTHLALTEHNCGVMVVPNLAAYEAHLDINEA